MTPRKGDGHFQWNTGGWFGGQIGCTAHLLVLGPWIAIHEILPGLLILAWGILANLVGFGLWQRRDKIAPYPALQLMLIVTLLAAVAGFVTAHYSSNGGKWAFVMNANSPWILLWFPVLMLLICCLEHAGKKRLKNPT